MSTSKSAVKLIPSDPAKVMVMRDVTPQITTLSTPFMRFGRIKIGGRGTLVKLQSGSVAVFSPVALTDDVKTKVTSMGTLKYIVAPDIEHHIFVSPWAAAYPNAQVIGMDGLPEKREQDPATKGVKFHHVFTPKNKLDMTINPEFNHEFDHEYVHSHGNRELVFLHKPSRSLIEADMLFNLPATEQFSKSGVSPSAGIFTKLFGNVMNTTGDMIWQKRLVWYGIAAKDRQGFAESIARINKWDFDRIIPCHGEVIENGAKGVWNKAFSWFLDMKQ